jgi:hypothetical protein
MCRIKISVAHQCGYCSTVRSNVAKAEGLTETMINDLFDYAGSNQFSAREKAALHYADLFKQGEHAIDKDEVYTELAKHFSDEEIIELGLFCAEVDGVGKFVKSLNVLSGRRPASSILSSKPTLLRSRRLKGKVDANLLNS